MVCAICLDALFAAPTKSDTVAPFTLGGGSSECIVALSCGHTFHLECTELWRASSLNRNCPMCNVEHFGPALLLHIECDLDHVSDRDDSSLGMERLAIGDPLTGAQSLCEASMDLAIMQAAKQKRLEAKAAGMEIELSTKSKRLVKKQGTSLSLARRVGHLEDRVRGLSALSKRHKAQILELQNALSHRKRTIAGLERQVRGVGRAQV
ncbi:hypothetical protein IWW37_000409 [Coemansia sp. RSA 2050]|nr:hypothetical protein IWW37_000409 [Coemansia sp. RSA 2050]KAJ2734190.1 hypothetical protein IW152_002529 [Coemansia sp. BCRC 34962]